MQRDGVLTADKVDALDYRRLCAGLWAAQAASPTARAHARLARPPAADGLAGLLDEGRPGGQEPSCRFRPDDPPIP